MTVTTFIVDDKGHKISAIVPIKKYEQLISELEELEDMKAYDNAMKKKQKYIPLEAALKEADTLRKKTKK